MGTCVLGLLPKRQAWDPTPCACEAGLRGPTEVHWGGLFLDQRGCLGKEPPLPSRCWPLCSPCRAHWGAWDGGRLAFTSGPSAAPVPKDRGGSGFL